MRSVHLGCGGRECAGASLKIGSRRGWLIGGSNAQKPAGASQAPKRLVRRAKSAIKAKVERPLKGKGGVAAEEARGGTGRKQETR